MTPTVTKTAADAYHVVCPLSETSKSHTWAWVYLHGMRLVVYSEYGCWAHTWHDNGRESLRQLILRMAAETGSDYLLRKLTRGVQSHFNLEATVADIRSYLADPDVVQQWKVEVEYATEELESLAECHGASADAFAAAVMRSGFLGWLYPHTSGDGLCVMEHDPACAEFLAVVWPHFVAELRREADAA